MGRWLPMLVLVGCATSGVRPGIGRETWWEAHTAHFQLRTNIDRGDAERVAGRLEEMWWRLARSYEVLLPGVAPPKGPLRVIHLARCSDVRILNPDASAVAATSSDYLFQTVIVSCDSRPAQETRELLLHELTHAFNRKMLGALPHWLNEGLAEYFSKLEGRQPAYERRPRRLPRLDDLLHRTWDDNVDRFSLPLTYYAARSLVHLLHNASLGHNARFRHLLGAIASGTAWERAWKDAYGDLPAGQLTDEYRDVPLRHAVLFAPPPGSPAPLPPEMRPLRLGEIHGTWAEFLLLTDDDPGAALAQLEYAVATDPHWPELHLWRGVALARGKRYEEAATAFRRHLDEHPGDVRARKGLSYALIEGSVPEEDDGLSPSPPKGIEAILGDVTALARLADCPSDLDEVAFYFAIARRPVVGLGFARRATAARGCISCLDTLAMLLHQLGRDGEALAHQERAVALLGRYASPAMKRRLAVYRRVAGR